MTAPMFLRYTYYHCTRSHNRSCGQKSITAEELERQISQRLSGISISTGFKEWAIKYLREFHQQERHGRNALIEAQQKAFRGCLERLDNLVKLKTSPGDSDGSLLSDAEYGRERIELLKEKATLEEMARDAGHRVEQWLTLSEQTFEFACRAQERFEKGDARTKKDILAIIGSNLVLKDKKLNIEA